MNTYMQKNDSTLVTVPENSTALLGVIKVVPLALLVTVGLVVFMERLVHMTDMIIDETEELHPVDVVWKPRVIKARIQKAPQTPDPVTPEPKIPENDYTITESFSVPMPSQTVSYKPETQVNFSMQMGVPIAQYLAAAKYPARALRKGIEGFVDIMFDVTEYGGTDNIEVLAAVPEGVFERAATKAVASWRFQPKTHNDKPVRFEGMKKRVVFEMQK